MQLELVNIKYDLKGNKTSFDIVDTETGELISPKFHKYTMKEDYENADVKAVEPMTAKEPLNDNELEKMLNSNEYYAEEKLDGTRATLHIGQDSCRIFSRRISKHTDWYVENSDSLPHIREIEKPDLAKTILDGELRIDGKEFKEVSSTLNCNWDKAIERQIELGFVTLHAFDIIFYKGIYIAKMPLWKRKQYLEKAIEELDSDYVKLEPYTDDKITKFISRKDPCVKLQQEDLRGFQETYPNLFKVVGKYALVTLQQGVEVQLDKRAWYEYIIANGGEGLMLKPKSGTYKHTRGREYTKWKKFITRDCVIMGFSEPTKEYKGKAPSTWEYYEDGKPVSKFYAMKWVGNLRFGVVVTSEEVVAWQKANKTTPYVESINGELVLEVGECAGFDEEQRKEFTEEQVAYKGQVVEILANEIFTKTGKLRHPRFLRHRNDKDMEQCIWKDHIGG